MLATLTAIITTYYQQVLILLSVQIWLVNTSFTIIMYSSSRLVFLGKEPKLFCSLAISFFYFFILMIIISLFLSLRQV